MTRQELTVPQKNELRQIIKGQGKSLLELQCKLMNAQAEGNLTSLDLLAVADSYLPSEFQIKMLEYGYEDYEHNVTDLKEMERIEMIFSAAMSTFFNADLEKVKPTEA